jgi:hypothetical protein
MGPLGLHQLGHMLAIHGRGQDSRLVHVSEAEIRKLKEWGGSGGINPHTGLMEFDQGGGEDSGGSTGGATGTGASDAGASDAGAAAAAAGVGAGAMADAGLNAGMTSMSVDAGVSAPDSPGLALDAAPSHSVMDSAFDPSAGPPGMPAPGPQAPDAAPLDATGLNSPAGFAGASGLASAINAVAGILGMGVPGLSLGVSGLTTAMDVGMGKNPGTVNSIGQEMALGIPGIGTVLGVEEAVAGLFGMTVGPDNGPLGPSPVGGTDSAPVTPTTDSSPAASLAVSPAAASATTPSNAYLARG